MPGSAVTDVIIGDGLKDLVTLSVDADGRSALVHNCGPRNSSKWFSNRGKAYQRRRKD
ncbi:hypothetical protein [Streptomyces sp. URMC 125]|uniref:hypothetical protein n=1 Tax=Streptomyces sp. URMC 125 TaxID=3423419 RepID=UPI003F1A29A4